MWAIGVLVGAYAAGAVSGRHTNPAVTLAQAAFGHFEWNKVVPYVLAQTLGAFVATASIHVSFGGLLAACEAAEGVVRGAAGSQLSAMAYTTYAPNPAIVGTATEHFAQVSHVRWFASEVIITAVLVFAILALIDQRNEGRPLANSGPFFIDLLVAGLVAYEAPVSMAALNPARDLGPRIFALLAGWGEIAFPGPRGGFWIPTVSTLVGGLVGGGIYAYLYEGVFKALKKPGAAYETEEAQARLVREDFRSRWEGGGALPSPEYICREARAMTHMEVAVPVEPWDEQEERAIQTLKDAHYWPTEAGVEAMGEEKGYERTREKLIDALDRLSGEELLSAYRLIADLAGPPKPEEIPEELPEEGEDE